MHGVGLAGRPRRWGPEHGTELVVVGGTVDGTPVRDGAAYDPATGAAADEWTPLAPLLGGHRVDHTADWIGDRLVVLGGERSEGVPVAHAWFD